MKKQQGLGRGLSALMGEMPVSIPHEIAIAAEGLQLSQELPLEQIAPGPYQPRRKFSQEGLNELAESIQKTGVMQPIIIRKIPSGQYEIVAGERRYRASKLANKTSIPVIIREFTDEEAMEFSLIENIQREDLSPIEEAIGYQRLMNEFHHTQEVLAKSVGKSRSHIANMLRLLQLPEMIRQYLEDGKLTMGHARSLIHYEHAVMLADRIVREGLSVRAVEQIVQEHKHPAPFLSGNEIAQPNRPYRRPYAPSPVKDHELSGLETQATEALGMRVTIEAGVLGGRVSIYFSSLEQLDSIMQCLGQGAVKETE